MMESEIAVKAHEYLSGAGFNGSVLIAREGRILLSAGYGKANFEWDLPNTIRTRFRIGCITQQFTAVAIMSFLEKKLLQIDTTINEFFPGIPHGDRITIHHLLTNSSGILNYPRLPGYNSRLHFSPEEIIDILMNAPLKYEPGSGYNYSNSNFLLLGKIIEKVTGTSYEEYLSENIFTPLQMSNTGVDRPDLILQERALGYSYSGEGLVNADYMEISNSLGSSSLYSTVEDLFLWDRALDTEKIISKDSIVKMLTPYVKIAKFNKYSYGYGWYITGEPRAKVSHGGLINGFHCDLARFVHDDAVIILLSNNDLLPISKISADLETIVFENRTVVPKKRQKVPADPAIYDSLAGKYKSSLVTGFLTVSRDGDQLFVDRLYMQESKRQLFELTPLNVQNESCEFCCNVCDATFTFLRDGNGDVIKLVYTWDSLVILFTKVL